MSNTKNKLANNPVIRHLTSRVERQAQERDLDNSVTIVYMDKDTGEIIIPEVQVALNLLGYFISRSQNIIPQTFTLADGQTVHTIVCLHCGQVKQPEQQNIHHDETCTLVAASQYRQEFLKLKV